MTASRPDPVMPASVEARTHDLEGAGQIYDNPGLAPELLWRVYDHPSAPGTWTRLPLPAY